MVRCPSSLESVANPSAVLILAGERSAGRAGFSAKQAGKHLVIAAGGEGSPVCLALPLEGGPEGKGSKEFPSMGLSMITRGSLVDK